MKKTFAFLAFALVLLAAFVAPVFAADAPAQPMPTKVIKSQTDLNEACARIRAQNEEYNYSISPFLASATHNCFRYGDGPGNDAGKDGNQ